MCIYCSVYNMCQTAFSHIYFIYPLQKNTIKVFFGNPFDPPLHIKLAGLQKNKTNMVQMCAFVSFQQCQHHLNMYPPQDAVSGRNTSNSERKSQRFHVYLCCFFLSTRGCPKLTNRSLNWSFLWIF